MIASICFLSVTMYTVVLENDLEKTVKRVVWQPTLRDKIYPNVFPDIDMLEKFFVTIFYECRLTLELIFYEKLVLNVELYLRGK